VLMPSLHFKKNKIPTATQNGTRARSESLFLSPVSVANRDQRVQKDPVLGPFLSRILSKRLFGDRPRGGLFQGTGTLSPGLQHFVPPIKHYG
jgi:hypothetical protein